MSYATRRVNDALLALEKCTHLTAIIRACIALGETGRVGGGCVAAASGKRMTNATRVGIIFVAVAPRCPLCLSCRHLFPPPPPPPLPFVVVSIYDACLLSFRLEVRAERSFVSAHHLSPAAASLVVCCRVGVPKINVWQYIHTFNANPPCLVELIHLFLAVIAKDAPNVSFPPILFFSVCVSPRLSESVALRRLEQDCCREHGALG